MAHARMVETYVERLVAELVGDRQEDVEVTEDGAFVLPFPARPMVDVVPGPADTTLRVRVRAAVVHDAELTPALLVALNEATIGLPYGRLYLDGSTVVVEESLMGAWIGLESLSNAVRFVDWAAWRFGQDLAATSGGRPAVVPAEDATDHPEATTGDVAPDGHAACHAPPGRDPGNTQVALAVDDGPTAAGGAPDRAGPDRAAAVNVAGYL